MWAHVTRVILCLATIALVDRGVSAGPIFDFETTPSGGTPSDNTLLTGIYTSGDVSVRFFFDKNGNNTFEPTIDALPVFEKAGPSDLVIGYVGSEGNDVADVGFESQLGDFFLRQPPANAFGSLPGTFIIDYDTSQTITSLSGEIWDIDGLNSKTFGTEQWLVEVLDAGGAVLASKKSPLGTLVSRLAPLDGKPWVFSFTGLPSGVDKVRLTFIGSKTSGIGLAFNNYSPTTSAVVPEPSALILLALGSLGLGVLGRRQRVRRGP